MTPATFSEEEKFSECYDSLIDVMKMDYPLALGIFKCLYEFLAENLESEIEIDSAVELPENAVYGASVKIEGAVSFVTGLLAEKKIFHKIAESYEHFKIDSLEEDFDAISELLNVVTGLFIVKIAAELGIDEELEPPRFGKTKKVLGVIKILVNVGTFYLYIGREEIFDN